MPGMDIAKRKGELTAGHKLPDAFSKVIAFEGWARSVVFGEEYNEPLPNYTSQMLALLAITAESADEVWNSTGVNGLQKILPDRPGETTGPLEITDLYVARSSFSVGIPSYVIISYIHLETGAEAKVTTGATNVQATLIGLLKNGVWPIRCQFKRGESKDKGDRYLIHMLPPD